MGERNSQLILCFGSHLIYSWIINILRTAVCFGILAHQQRWFTINISKSLIDRKLRIICNYITIFEVNRSFLQIDWITLMVVLNYLALYVILGSKFWDLLHSGVGMMMIQSGLNILPPQNFWIYPLITILRGYNFRRLQF